MRSGPVRRIVTMVFLALAASACGDVLVPLSELSLYVSASPDDARVGDTVHLVAVVNNASGVTIEAGRGCGPGMGFILADPGGTETDLFATLPWLCPGMDSHEIRPGETDVVEWPWVPEAPGVYRVWSILWVRDSRPVESQPAEVRVVER